MLEINTLKQLESDSSFLTVRYIIAMDAILNSTKTKAKDFLPDSTTFEDRVIKKYMRLKLAETEEHAMSILKLYNELTDKEIKQTNS
jgi:hypothetical protein